MTPKALDKGQTYYVNDGRALDLISPAEAIFAIRSALANVSLNEAHSLPRRRIYVEKSPNRYLWHNSMAAWHEGERTIAVRTDVATVQLSDDGKMEFPGDFSGFVMLFDADTCTPYGIIQDHILSPLRVAATSAIASQMMARSDSRVLSLMGGGEQAVAHATCFLEVFPNLEEIRFFVRTASRRKMIVDRLSAKCNVPIVSMESPQELITGADIVVACTNAKDPVLRGEWIEPGQHLVTVASPDKHFPRQEIDQQCALAASTIVVNSVEQIFVDEQEPLKSLIEQGAIEKGQIIELTDLLHRDIMARASDRAVTLYDNNVGMGVQFAALGPIILERAFKAGLAEQISSNIFMTRRATLAEQFAP
jgi:ornithine cyclodeaminase/alanine dehydrogenase-like protein (mu-crystallin family)